MKTFRLLAIGLALSACSIEISDPTAAATAASQLPGATPAPTRAPTLAAPAWETLGLTGSLIYTQGAQGIKRLDLATGNIDSVFTPPEDAWLTAAAVSPDGKTLVMAYAPPPPAGEVQLGYTSLYQFSIGSDPAAAPEPLITRNDPQESYFTPAWSPDGQYIYYAHFIPVRGSGGNTFKYTLERIRYSQGGRPDILIEDSIWPRLSADGTKLAYLKFDTENFNQELYMADADGKNGSPVLPPGEFPSVDAQFFSPDGKSIIFNAVGEGRSPALSWLDRLTGAQIAEAHNVPSDWWSVTLGESKATRLTEIYDMSMYGNFSPDGQYIAFTSATGMHLMKPDGSGLTPLAPIDAPGTVEWAP
ncbi:MAG: hypothetical protein FJ030_07910 [Chloroflexi bacterium]|nr:hypothetical protein [Chloroflexota bacterium]